MLGPSVAEPVEALEPCPAGRRGAAGADRFKVRSRRPAISYSTSEAAVRLEHDYDGRSKRA